MFHSNPPAKQLSTVLVKQLKSRKKRQRDVVPQIRKAKTEILQQAKRRAQMFHGPAFFITNERKCRRDRERIHSAIARSSGAPTVAATLTPLSSSAQPISKGKDDKLGIVVRTWPSNDSAICEHSKHILEQFFGLTKMNSAKFVRINVHSLAKLAAIRPFVVWGVPAERTVNELLWKAGRIWKPRDSETPEGQILIGKTGSKSQQSSLKASLLTSTKKANATQNKTVRLRDNRQIEAKFGESRGFLCRDDLVRELVCVRPGFDEIASQWLAPFKLRAPPSGWKNYRKAAVRRPGKMEALSRDLGIDDLVSRII